MEEEQAYLAIYLDAPLQSWGHQSRFDRRTTLPYPTRSGVLGMICAAMGIERSDSAALAEFAALEIAVYALNQAGRLTDYHTVGGGWNPKTNRQNIVRTADGKVGDTVVTRREYLENARFGVVIRGGRRQTAAIEAALRNPRWGVWLGRKSCIPSSPLAQGVHDSREAAIERLAALAGGQLGRSVVEVSSFEDGNDTIMDTPIDFKQREFAPRRVLVD